MTTKTPTPTSTKPLKAQYSLAQYIALSSLSIASLGAILGLGGTIAGKPSLIAGGFALASPALVCFAASSSVGEELSKRLAVATKDTAAIDEAYRAGYRAGCDRASVESTQAIDRAKAEIEAKHSKALTKLNQRQSEETAAAVEEERAKSQVRTRQQGKSTQI
jgi:hypothetical protein